ncbi:MAG: hypothetical protein HY899_00180 [Deltaproteobacteria bacterium]|nr:hypothetical protein [Deltaproteobacteria bacterium]
MSRGEQHDTGRVSAGGSVLRRFEGAHATELYLLCCPEPGASGDVARQAESACRSLEAVLRAQGGTPQDIATETVFFSNIREDLGTYRQARRRVFGQTDADGVGPASTFIEQPPLAEDSALEVAAFAVVPHDRSSAEVRYVRAPSACNCEDCARVDARVSVMGGHKHLHAGNLYGANGTAFDEAYSMFCAAQELLRSAGMDFHQVVRTWIYIRDIDCDYDDLNRARRFFFERNGIKLRPASTGIQGGPFPAEHNFSMGLYAVAAPAPLEVHVMTTPTLNEAWMYGADFSRGLEVVEANKTALYISGTASVDEDGRTAGVGDFASQADRMLRNVSTLLQQRGASFADVLSAVTYLKDPADAAMLRRILRDRSLEGFPNALVRADVCRSGLLCEMEAIAALPRRRNGN